MFSKEVRLSIKVIGAKYNSPVISSEAWSELFNSMNGGRVILPSTNHRLAIIGRTKIAGKFLSAFKHLHDLLVLLGYQVIVDVSKPRQVELGFDFSGSICFTTNEWDDLIDDAFCCSPVVTDDDEWMIYTGRVKSWTDFLLTLELLDRNNHLWLVTEKPITAERILQAIVDNALTARRNQDFATDLIHKQAEWDYEFADGEIKGDDFRHEANGRFFSLMALMEELGVPSGVLEKMINHESEARLQIAALLNGQGVLSNESELLP